ncbi:MAG: hypothetical protein Q9220_005094 [cf. Caloplaca sp. 1 TL-2023]
MPRQYPGPPISDQQKEEQKTKKYPHMMPAEGTFMFWFLNNRMVHMGITLTVLFSLSIFVFLENFHRTTPFIDMLPPGKDFWSHPLSFIATYGHVYKLHTDHISAETAERRKKKVDDVQKRSRYRQAHGLETEGFGGWTVKSNAESLGPVIPTQASAIGTTVPSSESGANGSTSDRTDQATDGQRDADPSTVLNFERQKRPPVKRWLGIWE